MSHKRLPSSCLCTSMKIEYNFDTFSFQNTKPFLDSVPRAIWGMHGHKHPSRSSWLQLRHYQIWRHSKAVLPFAEGPKFQAQQEGFQKWVFFFSPNWKHIASYMSHPGQPACALPARTPISFTLPAHSGKTPLIIGAHVHDRRRRRRSHSPDPRSHLFTPGSSCFDCPQLRLGNYRCL